MWTEEWLEISQTIRLPLKELSFRFARSSGSGGQNVNKIETKVLLEFDITKTSALEDGVRLRMITRLSHWIDNDGILRLTSQRFRSQYRNRLDCVERLQILLQEALVEQAERKPTRPSYGMIQRRLETKRHQSQRKKERGWNSKEE